MGGVLIVTLIAVVGLFLIPELFNETLTLFALAMYILGVLVGVIIVWDDD
jgi:hypothetical protein